MPNCDFYAAGEDHRAVLEFLLHNRSCRILESYSRYEQKVREFESLGDFCEHFQFHDWEAGASETMLLQLYPVSAKGTLVIERIKLSPKHCDGATFRYCATGWGLVQLYLEPVREGRLRPSHTNHNSEKRAAAWQQTCPNLGSTADWDWRAITSFSRRLNHYIRKLSIGKRDSRVVLPQAHRKFGSGVIAAS